MAVAVVALLATPGVAWGHGMHYIGTLEATGNGTPTSTVSATTGQGVTGSESATVSRAGGCAGSPTGGIYGPFDQGYNARGTPAVAEPQGCVDVHTTTGSTSLNPLDPEVTISGSGFRPDTAFGVTYLFPNDRGDTDGDTEAQTETDINDPFCHRGYFQAPQLFVRATVTTGPANGQPSGGFNAVTVQLEPFEVGGGQLCISSERFPYKGPTTGTNPETGAYVNTSQGQSVRLNPDLS